MKQFKTKIQENKMNSHCKTLTWTYFKVDNKDMYFGWRWKKQAYNDTVRYAQQKISQDLDKFTRKRKYLDIFNLSKENKKHISKWEIHVDIPKYKDVKDSIIRKMVHKKWFKKSYVTECRLNCTVLIIVW